MDLDGMWTLQLTSDLLDIHGVNVDTGSKGVQKFALWCTLQNWTKEEGGFSLDQPPDGKGMFQVLQFCAQVSCKTIFATMGAYQSPREQVFANRGITLSSVGTRKAPNAFTFLREVEALSRAGHGGASQQFDDPRLCNFSRRD